MGLILYMGLVALALAVCALAFFGVWMLHIAVSYSVRVSDEDTFKERR